MNELVRVAARSIGATDCVSVRKCPDGMYNKCFILTMDDRQEVIAKVPNPNAGVSHYTTASEVATMDFARDTLHAPLPKVYAWNSRADDAVGAEYIIMQKMPGVQLSEVWRNMKLADKMKLCLNLALVQEKFLSVSFRLFGGLYYKHDLDLQSDPDDKWLYTNEKGEKVHDGRFAIGPMTGRDWSDWPTPSDYHKAIGLRELTAIRSLSPPLSKQTVMVCGPGLYRPEVVKKLSAIESYLRIHDALLPPTSHDPAINITASTLWHNDLHEENIFVDRENPTRIVGIIDWQSVGDLLPLFNHTLQPAFVQYSSGPMPETLEPPELADISGLLPEEQTRATAEYFEKALFIAWLKIARKKLPAAYRAFEYQKQTANPAFDLVTLAGRLFEFGEAHVHALPFPLAFDDASLPIIEDDCERAMYGMEIMNDFKARLGPLWPDKGAVSHELYDETKKALRELKSEIIDTFAASPEERAEFEELWPFDD
ncbi:hypothetical protein DV735_g1481, partial [Chaetothyriales sp. CBS 134920]